MTNHKTAADILLQLAGEAEARKSYEELLATGELSEEDAATIREIESDEANHMLKLQAMLKNYDGSISASDDGAKEALEQIEEGI
jgi:rubrerythrin